MSLKETLEELQEKWGNYDSNTLLNDEVKSMNPREREEYLGRIANLYLQEAELADERYII